MKQVNHTARTKKWLVDEIEAVTHVEGTEHYNAFSHRKHDLLGFIDLLVLLSGETWGIQVTSRTNHYARREKILESRNALLWCEAGNKVFIISWAKKNGRWQAKMEEVEYEAIATRQLGHPDTWITGD